MNLEPHEKRQYLSRRGYHVDISNTIAHLKEDENYKKVHEHLHSLQYHNPRKDGVDLVTSSYSWPFIWFYDKDDALVFVLKFGGTLFTNDMDFWKREE